MDSPITPKPGFLQRTFTGYFIDLQDMPVSMIILTLGGYFVVLGMLLMTLVVELAGNRLPAVEFSITGQTDKVPLVVLAVAGLAFILGWVYLLAGAAAARVRIFLPVLALFALQLFLQTNITILNLYFYGTFFLIVLAVYGFTARTGFWREHPGLHFYGWLAAVSVITLLTIGLSATNAEVARSLSANFSIVLLLTLAFWVLLGLSIIDLGIRIGRMFTRLFRKYLPFHTFSALVVFVLLILPAAALLVFWLTKDGFWLLAVLIPFLLILAALVLWIARRWSVTTASVLLTLSLASPVVVLGLSMAFSGQDFAGLLLNMTGIFPPTLLFVGLTTYNLFGMGVAFTGVDGRILPRKARILLYFGTLLLVVACMLFTSNERVSATNELSLDFQTMTNNLFALSALLLGVPYLVWMVWKRREMLVGLAAEMDLPPRWTGLERIPPLAWIALALVIACACSCLLVGILFALV
jgi:hypothetical protein